MDEVFFVEMAQHHLARVKEIFQIDIPRAPIMLAPQLTGRMGRRKVICNGKDDEG